MWLTAIVVNCFGSGSGPCHGTGHSQYDYTITSIVNYFLFQTRGKTQGSRTKKVCSGIPARQPQHITGQEEDHTQEVLHHQEGED